MASLSHHCKFGSWVFGYEMTFGSNTANNSYNHKAIDVSITDYINLANPLNQDLVPEHRVILDNPVKCKILRFQATAYWGVGPGLQYLGIIEEEKNDENGNANSLSSFGSGPSSTVTPIF